MKVLTSLVFLGICVAMTVGHLCLLSPPQRGSMVGLNKQGAADCILVMGPCGGRPARRSPVLIPGGENYTLSFQKNLDHYDKATPGYFSISAKAPQAFQYHDFKEVARVPDMGEPSLSIYSVNITVPKVSSFISATLQVRYVTNNKNAPPVFYQCSDVGIYQGRNELTGQVVQPEVVHKYLQL